MSADLALDLGTAFTRVADASGAVVLEEPTVAAVHVDSGRLVCFGRAALALSRRAAGRVRLVRPVRHGQLADLRTAEAVLGEVLRRLRAAGHGRPAVLACVHCGATGVDRRALERVLRRGGARRVGFIEAPLAAAIALGLAVEEPRGAMVVDVGAGTADLAVLALGGIACSRSVRRGGDDVLEAIRTLLARRHNVVVDAGVAAEVRAALATLDPRAPEAYVEVLGRDAKTGRPASAVLARSELRPLLADVYAPLLETARACLAEAPPELANDVLGSGVVLTGGALVDGLERAVAGATGVSVHVAGDGGRSAVLGAARRLGPRAGGRAPALSSGLRR
jgi:rod shape-determining protein MreB